MSKILWAVEGLKLSIGRQTLFNDTAFSIGDDERVALVGRNGCGKSTLMKVIAGLEQASDGNFSAARNLRAAYMPQDFAPESDLTVRELVQQGLAWFQKLQSRYHTLSPNSREYDSVEHLLTLHDAWNLDNKLEVMMEKLALQDQSRKINNLSGGELRRVMLARTLIAEPELLLLDEPTNHLDVDTITWIEEFLTNYKGACFFVTHDRYFLDRIATRIVELDNGKLYSVTGSYADFLEAKAEREYAEDQEAARRNSFLRREVDWVRRSPKARLRRNLGRIKRYYEIAAIDAPQRTGNVELVIPPPSRLGNQVVQLNNLTLTRGGKTLFRDFSYEFTAKHKVGIVGPNGIGKTSLLKLITQELIPDSGLVKVADTVEFNYVDQSRVTLNPELTVCEEIAGDSDSIRLGDEKISVWGYLKRFLFEDERINTQVKFLSGGEKARLTLAKILRNGGNFLILDEPTNDLDLSSLRILEESLIQYDSAMIVVSHDRYFLNRVCNHIIAFEPDSDELQTTIGDYDYYLMKKKERMAKSPDSNSTASPSPRKQPAPQQKKNSLKKLSYMEERELKLLDSDIPAAENAVHALEAQFNDPTLFSERPKDVPRIQKELEEAKKTLEHLYERWEFLENKKEQNSTE